MRILSALLAASSIGLAAPALAQEMAPFTGPHAEVLLGYDNLSGGNDGSDDSADGLGYGVALGYDFQLGGLIAGIEGEWTDSNTDLTGADIDVTGDNYRLETGRDLYIGARLGFAATPSTMVYLKGGYTNARIESRYTNATGTQFDEGVTMDGWRAGVGVEQKFNLFGPSGFVKAEYRYSNYSNLDFADFDAAVDVDRHQVMAGVGIRF